MADDRLVPLPELETALQEAIARGRATGAMLDKWRAETAKMQTAIAETQAHLREVLRVVQERIAAEAADRSQADWWRDGPAQDEP